VARERRSAEPSGGIQRSDELQAAAELHVSSNVPALGWTVSCDPVLQQSTVEWRGGSADDYPWGREDTRELMVYKA
jgi:hypothetical protein